MAGTSVVDSFLRIVKRVPWSVLGGGCIGLAVALLIYDRRILAGNPQLFQTLGGDSGASLAGFRYFVNESWSWPPFRLTSLGPPASSVATTDSNAALALLAKVSRPIGLTAEDWWGSWFAISLALQGAGAVVAVRAFGVKNWGIELATATLAVFSPILLFRVDHPNLRGQFLLLLAIALVGHLGRYSNPRRLMPLGTVLVLLSGLVHPYFLIMVVVTVTGGVVAETFRGKISIRATVIWGAATSALLATLLLLAGMIQSNLVPDDQGFVAYSTMLFGLVIPQNSGLWPGETLTTHPFSPEGYAYLGAGVLAAFVIGMVRSRLAIARWIQRHQVSAMASGLLALYAISPRVVAWRTTIWDLRELDLTSVFFAVALLLGAVLLRPKVDPGRHRWYWPAALLTTVGLLALFGAVAHPEPMTADSRRTLTALIIIGFAALLVAVTDSTRARRQPAVVLTVVVSALLAILLLFAPSIPSSFTNSLRASGRMIWMSWYWILIVAAVAVARSSSRRVGAMIMAGCCVLQVLDTRPLHSAANETMVPTEARSAFMKSLQSVVSAHEGVHLEPPLSCTLTDISGFVAFRDVVIAGSIAGIPIDTNFSARSIAEPCPESVDVSLSSSTLTVLASPLSREDLNSIPPGTRCGELGALYLCSPIGQILEQAGIVMTPES